VTDRSAELAEAVSQCANLNTLNIGGIGLKAKGLIAVLNSLPRNVKTLVIDDNFEVSLVPMSRLLLVSFFLFLAIDRFPSLFTHFQGSPSTQEDLGYALAKLLDNHPAITFLSLGAKSSQAGLPLKPLFSTQIAWLLVLFLDLFVVVFLFLWLTEFVFFRLD
jgi:hypothetical protein